MMPVVWCSRIVGYMADVPANLPTVRFHVMPQFVYAAPPPGLAPNIEIETVSMRAVDGELHVDSLRHLKRLRGFAPQDRWLKLLAEADEE
jgi:hypothetical protein